MVSGGVACVFSAELRRRTRSCVEDVRTQFTALASVRPSTGSLAMNTFAVTRFTPRLKMGNAWPLLVPGLVILWNSLRT